MKHLIGRRSRIFVTLLWIIGGAAIVPLVVLGLFTASKNREALQDESNKYLTRSATAIAEQTDSYIRNYLDQIGKIADSMKVAAAVSGETDPFIYMGDSGLIEEYHRKDPNFLSIRAINRQGQGGVSEPADLEKGVKDDLNALAKNAISGTAGSAERVVKFVRIDSLKDSGIIVVVPVKTSVGEVFGVVEALVSLRPVGEQLVEAGKRRGYTAYLVDERGDLLLHSDPLVESNHPNYASVELVAEFIRKPGRFTRSYEVGEGSGRRRVIGTLAPVGSPAWGVIVELDEKIAYAVVTQVVRRTIFTGLLVLALAVAASAFVARQLAQPINELAEKSREIAAGNYGQRVEVRSKNEIGELAETFNEMGEELEKQMEALKRAARENEDLFLSSIRALAAAIDAKDPYTRGHSERVCRYSIIIAKNMNLTREDILRIRVSALLHDVGKIGIDDRILRKPAALTDEEFEIMKQHPSKGAQIMESIPQLRDIIPGMKYHHEKWEGGGYPDGLVGEDIPMQARIVAVADTFDAMTTTRPYQKAMELSYVITKIKSFAHTRFDPAVVDSLVRAFQKGDIALEESSRSVA